MPPSVLTVLLPCHSLEDFPRHLEGEEADGLLAGWSALWHPALIAAAGRLPAWHRADLPPTPEPGHVLVVPKVASAVLPAGWSQRAAEQGATVVEGVSQRSELVAACLAALEPGQRDVDAELAADFLALGTVYLFSELLARHMRYMSQIDETHLGGQVVAAAQAAREGNSDVARAKLGACFDLLRQARDRYYPVEAYLLDLTLVADTTLGSGLIHELAEATPRTLLLSGADLERLASQNSEAFELLKSRQALGSIGLAGGEQQWGEAPLAPLEATLADFKQGRQTFERLLGTAPTVFGRLRFGLSPLTPQWLARLGFRGALAFTLDDGQFPQGDQAKIRWEGGGGTAIDALARVPLDAANPGSWMRFAHKLGESMDMDHVATVCLAHWAGQSHPALDDLRRMGRYSAVLGKFVTAEAYFAETESPSRGSRFPADQYRSPYLAQQAAEGDALSRYVAEETALAARDAAQGVAFLARMMGPAPLDGSELPQSMAALAAALPRAKAAAAQGFLLVNPRLRARRQCVATPRSVTPGGPVKAVQSDGQRHFAVVDVPAMGFAWLPAGPASASRKDPLLADGLKLRNEYCEVTIDARTGGIRAIHDFQLRANRLSQRLVFRDSTEPGLEDGLRMQADKVEIVVNGPVLAAIESSGSIAPAEGPAAAKFRQRVEIVRASRVVRLEIELECLRPPGADPWNSYYASRWAWGDGAELRRSVGASSRTTAAKRIEASRFVEIDDDRRRTTILTGGLPYHRRLADDQFDTLLVAGGERSRRFQLGIGIDVPCPAEEAWSLVAPPTLHPDNAPPPEGDSTGWLFHLDSRTVLATAWEPLLDDNRVVGFRVRLLETAGKSQRVRLQTFRAVSQARCTDFRGHALADLTLEEDAIAIDLAAEEWAQIEARW